MIVIGDGVVSCEIELFVVIVFVGFEGVGWRVVSEVGVSVYSVFEIVVKELLDIDVLLCGVVFIV